MGGHIYNLSKLLQAAAGSLLESMLQQHCWSLVEF
jgi:hypothetical protein